MKGFAIAAGVLMLAISPLIGVNVFDYLELVMDVLIPLWIRMLCVAMLGFWAHHMATKCRTECVAPIRELHRHTCQTLERIPQELNLRESMDTTIKQHKTKLESSLQV